MIDFIIIFGIRNISRKMSKYVDVLSYFSLNEWDFDNTNTMLLWDKLNSQDKKNFYFDIRTLNWHEYWDTISVSMREFLGFDFLDTLEEGRRHTKR